MINEAQALYDKLAEKAEECYRAGEDVDDDPVELETLRNMLDSIIDEVPDSVIAQLRSLLIDKDERIKATSFNVVKDAFQTELREYSFDSNAHYIIEGMVCYIFEGWDEVLKQVEVDDVFQENLISYIFD